MKKFCTNGGAGDLLCLPARFVHIDRQTPMFLPRALRPWVAEGHIVHFIPDAVEPLPAAHFHVNHGGTGRAQSRFDLRLPHGQ